MSLKALLIFGQKFGRDNEALLSLGREIAKLGVRVDFKQFDDHWKEIGPYEIVIGHSFGGYQAVGVVLHLTTTVRYLALIDYCDPRWFPVGFKYYWPKFQIPSNVEKCDAFTRGFNLLPPAGTIGNPSASFINHTGINASHAGMPRNEFVVSTIIKSIGEIL